MRSAVRYRDSIEEPLNREPSPEQLVSSFITNADGYDRNHGPIPIIDADLHRVIINGAVRNQLSLSVSDLRSFEQHSVLCALQCAGNRRHTMRTLIKEVQGIDWHNGAVMNCEWRGPRLRDVLAKAEIGIDRGQWSQLHVEFGCHQNPSSEDEWYGSSIPLHKAMAEDAEVVLALERNGEPLSVSHGYPVRIIAPGIAGVRSVKWVDQIQVQFMESSNHYQQRDYKVLPADVGSAEEAEKVWSQVSALQEMPINSAIAVPRDEASVERDQNGSIHVQGYAVPGYGSGPITSVQVSADNGSMWQEADLYVGTVKEETKYDLTWAWCLWQINIKVESGSGRTLLSRAVDAKGNMQNVARSGWNLRGVAYNGYGEVNNLNVL